MSWRTLIAAGCATVLLLNSQTDAIGQDDDARLLTDKIEVFFESLNSGTSDPKAVFGGLLAGSQLGVQESEQLQNLLEQYGQLEQRYGKFLKATKYDVRKVGDNLIFLTYFYQTERFPVVWRFVYYRPPSEEPDAPDWFVVRLSFDTRIENLPQPSRSL